MKSKTMKKLIVGILVSTAIAAAGVGIFYAVSRKSTDPVYVYDISMIGMTEYWGNTQESYGPVTTDRIQPVYLSETQTVTEILVKEGDSVKKGDKLLKFDTTLTDLSLEKKALEVDKLKLQLVDEQDQLNYYYSLKPYTPPSEKKKDTGADKTLEDAYSISNNRKYDGSSKKKAIICWIRTDTPINQDLLEAIRVRAEKLQNKNAQIEAEKKAKESSNNKSKTESENTVSAEKIVVKSYYVVFKITSGNQEQGPATTWQGVKVNSTKQTMQLYDASSLQDYTQKASQEEEVDYGSGYTAAEIGSMIIDQRKQIKDLEFKIKVSEAEYKIMQAELGDGYVYAKFDGEVMSLCAPEEAIEMEKPVLKISDGGGFYIEGSISELDRESVQLGQTVTIVDYRNGGMLEGTVSSIGEYPSSNDGWSNGNPNVSYYPFYVFADDSADLQEGSYVSIQYSVSGQQNGIYIENAYVRQENGTSYVYRKGADGKLEKCNVTTGRKLWGSYTEVLSGLEADDKLAFPYGKQVFSGAQTIDGDYSTMYD